MKSEKQSATGSADIRQPGESVPITAARVFSNYVLVPAARHPDEAKASSRLHGAALLVFADKAAEKVELRTGYATHVAGNSTLRPREDVRDQIVSGHKNQPRAEAGKETPNDKPNALHGMQG